MKQNGFQIFIEQLRNGQQKKILENASVEFLDVSEKDLHFKKDVHIAGETYIAGDMLVLRLELTAWAVIPCSICNESVDVEIAIPDLYHAEPLKEIKSGVYDFTEVVRQAILLEVPPFAECNGSCRKRKDIQKYLVSPDKTDEEGYKPFADL